MSTPEAIDQQIAELQDKKKRLLEEDKARKDATIATRGDLSNYTTKVEVSAMITSILGQYTIHTQHGLGMTPYTSDYPPISHPPDPPSTVATRTTRPVPDRPE